VVITRAIYRAARYSLAGKCAGSGALMVEGNKAKVEETGGNSLE